MTAMLRYVELCGILTSEKLGRESYNSIGYRDHKFKTRATIALDSYTKILLMLYTLWMV